MPRMSKKRRLELAYFLNERNRITHNPQCRKCQKDCKQSFRAVLIFCPKYLSKRKDTNQDVRSGTKVDHDE